MGGDHQADSVSERETNVKDPGDQVLVDNLGRGVQPEEGDQRAADIGKNTNQSRCNGQVLVFARLDHMLESRNKLIRNVVAHSVSDLIA